jgi:ribosomal protein S18 acetylase RimI-like enzyme
LEIKKTTMDIQIRKEAEPDLPAVLRLYAQPGMDNGRVLTLDTAAMILQRMTTYPEYAVYVATMNCSVVGTFALLVMDNLAHLGKPSAIVEDVCVDDQLHRRGIGRAMMQFAMEFARERGCYKLSLSSNASRERAHTFYRSLGFEQHGLSFHVQLK